jgi:7-keto-8-aminopelargonate synthetase-like enzyme
MADRNALEELVQRRDPSNGQAYHLLQNVGLIGQILQSSTRGANRIGGRKVSSFVDSDILGLSRHPQVVQAACMGAKLAGISSGMPRHLGRDQLSQTLENAIARLVRQEQAAIFSSTTHIAMDVLPLLAGSRGVVLVDAWAYPISLEGAYAAARQGAKITRFAHNDPNSLEQALRTHRHVRDKVIVCDGVYPAGGRRAVLQEFSLLADRYGAVMYIDDAHGLGIFGAESEKNPPYGSGGGGTPVFDNLPAGNLVHVASLSKALGVPLAFASGPAKFIDFLNRNCKSFIHNSQPALPVIATAIGALRVNLREGDQLREKLAQRVKRFIRGFDQTGMHIAGNGYFPIQSLYFRSPNDAWQTARKLSRNGIWPLLQISPIDFARGGALRFVITVKHTTSEIERIDKVIRSCSYRPVFL